MQEAQCTIKDLAFDTPKNPYWHPLMTVLYYNAIQIYDCIMKLKTYSLPLTKLGLWRLCVPHLAQASFLRKIQTVQNVCLISLNHVSRDGTVT